MPFFRTLPATPLAIEIAILTTGVLLLRPGTQTLSSVIEFQGELNLSRIIWRIPGRINLAKVRTLEVERAWSGDPVAPAGKSRGVEVWMIENVEEFPAELQTEAFGETEILEN